MMFVYPEVEGFTHVQDLLEQSQHFEQSLRFDDAISAIDAALVLDHTNIDLLLEKSRLQYLMGNFGACFRTCMKTFQLYHNNESFTLIFKEYENAIRRVLFLNPKISLRDLDVKVLLKLFRRNRFSELKTPGTNKWVDVFGNRCIDEDILSNIEHISQLKVVADITDMTTLKKMKRSSVSTKRRRKPEAHKFEYPQSCAWHSCKSTKAPFTKTDSFEVYDKVKKLFKSCLATFKKGSYEECRKIGNELLDILKRASEELLPGKPRYLANTYNMIGKAYRQSLQFEKAVEYHGKEIETVEQYDLDSTRVRAFSSLGTDYLFMEEFEKALQLFEIVLDLAKKDGDRAKVLHEISCCYIELGDLSSAQEAADESLACARKANDSKLKLYAKIVLARIAVISNRFHAALACFAEARSISMKIEDVEMKLCIEKAISDVHKRRYEAELGITQGDHPTSKTGKTSK